MTSSLADGPELAPLVVEDAAAGAATEGSAPDGPAASGTTASAPTAPAPPAPSSRAALETELELARAARSLQITDSHAPATRRAYEADWRAFRAWCERLAAVDPSLVALPASDDTLSTYVGALDRRSPSSVRRAVAAIRLAHERAGHPALLEERPATVAALRGHARRHAKTPRKRQTAATERRVEAMADTCDTTRLLGLRNRALLLVGVDTGLRRSELVAIDVEHLERGAGAVTVRLPTAKGDQTGDGAHVAILARPGSPWCPVEALDRWCAAANRRTGPVFVSLGKSRFVERAGEQRLSDRAVARVVKAAAAAAGLPGDWAGHSLRRGMVTSALDAGVAPHLVQRHARHRDLGSTLAYGERGQALQAHPRAGRTTIGSTPSGNGPEDRPVEERSPSPPNLTDNGSDLDDGDTAAPTAELDVPTGSEP